MPSANLDNDGLRNVAVLVSSLDEPTAAVLLAQLSSSERGAIEAQIGRLGEVSLEEQRAIAQTFVQQLGGQHDGKSHLGSVGPETRMTDDRPDKEPARKGEETRCSQRALWEAPPEMLSQFLRDEQPQTVAVVLSDLPPERAAALLELLPCRLQHEVVCRLAEFGTIDEGVVENVRDALLTQIEQTQSQQRSRQAGARILQSILCATHEGARTRWIRRLSLVDAKLAAALGPDARAPSATSGWKESPDEGADAAPWHRLLDLADEPLCEVISRVGRDVALLALAGADTACAEELLARLPSDTAENLRAGLKNLGPLRLADICQARQWLLDAAHAVDARQSAVAAEEFGRLKLSA